MFAPNGEDDYLKISITDNGLGIKKKDRKKLFKVYGSIKSESLNQNGIGLGLVISKMIIDKLDGQINFLSKWK